MNLSDTPMNRAFCAVSTDDEWTAKRRSRQPIRTGAVAFVY
jgi:hypothetical protein